jgi:hypothetical protein
MHPPFPSKIFPSESLSFWTFSITSYYKSQKTQCCLHPQVRGRESVTYHAEYLRNSKWIPFTLKKETLTFWNTVFSSFLEYRTRDKFQIPAILSGTHHRKNPLISKCFRFCRSKALWSYTEPTTARAVHSFCQSLRPFLWRICQCSLPWRDLGAFSRLKDVM